MRASEKPKNVCASLIPSSMYANKEFSFHPFMLPTDQRFTEQV